MKELFFGSELVLRSSLLVFDLFCLPNSTLFRDIVWTCSEPSEDAGKVLYLMIGFTFTGYSLQSRLRSMFIHMGTFWQ